MTEVVESSLAVAKYHLVYMFIRYILTRKQTCVNWNLNDSRQKVV